MKQYALVSGVVVIAILGVLSADVVSQKMDSKVNAFHSSLKQEGSGDYKKAVQAIEPAIKEHKDDYLLNLRLGWLYYLDKNYTESKQYYSNAVKLGGRSVEALLGHTLPLAALGEWNAVEEDYRVILGIDPMQYTAKLRLGHIFLNKGAYADARAYLERAHSQYPGSYDPNLSLGWTYYYLGEKKKAESLLTS
ncbi:MAG: tetratricopeptide repeat protein, partial [Bacteroidota bacterium]